jgi:hypothetical protein
MNKIFQRNKNVNQDKPAEKRESLYEVRLPIDALPPSFLKCKNIEGGKIQVNLVYILNTDQLASEIAKALKDSSNNSGKSDNNGK